MMAGAMIRGSSIRHYGCRDITLVVPPRLAVYDNLTGPL